VSVVGLVINGSTGVELSMCELSVDLSASLRHERHSTQRRSSK